MLFAPTTESNTKPEHFLRWCDVFGQKLVCTGWLFISWWKYWRLGARLECVTKAVIAIARNEVIVAQSRAWQKVFSKCGILWFTAQSWSNIAWALFAHNHCRRCAFSSTARYFPLATVFAARAHRSFKKAAQLLDRTFGAHSNFLGDFHWRLRRSLSINDDSHTHITECAPNRCN